MPRLPENVVDRLYGRGTTFIAGYLAPHRWITPNRISLAGFLIGGVVTSVSILTLPLWVAGLLFAVGDILDCLDGNVARMQGTDSSEGAIVDAVLDRYTDFLAFGALTYLVAVILDEYSDFLIGASAYLTENTALLLGLAALMGTMLTPYVRAKTEAEGKRSVPSIGDRGWRNRILVFGLILNQPIWTLGLVAIAANISALHRMIIALRKEVQ